MSDTKDPKGFVRVKLENGAEASVSAVYAEAQGLSVIKDADASRGGRALPATYPETKAAKKAASSEKA